MAEQRQFFVSYSGELAPGDRDALTRPGWKLYENGVGVKGAWIAGRDPPSDGEWRQFVRLSASDESDALHSVVGALGHAPGGLHVFLAKQGK